MKSLCTMVAGRKPNSFWVLRRLEALAVEAAGADGDQGLIDVPAISCGSRSGFRKVVMREYW